MGASIHFAGSGLGLIAGSAGLQQRLVGLLAGGTAFTGDQRLGADLRGLHTVVSVSGTGRRMDRLDHRGKDFHTAVEGLQVGLHAAANLVAEAGALFPSNSSRVREAKSCTRMRLAVLRIRVGISALL